MLQADDEDDMMEMQMKSPFGSSFRTFNATDYKPIGKPSCPHLTSTDLFSVQSAGFVLTATFDLVFYENILAG